MTNQLGEPFYVVKWSTHLARWDFSRGKTEGTFRRIFEPRSTRRARSGTGGELNRDDVTAERSGRYWARYAEAISLKGRT